LTSANILAVTHVTVIDATGAAALPDRTILITDDLITDIGPKKTSTCQRMRRSRRAAGKFVIPGLWDMHVHCKGSPKKLADRS